MEFSSGSENLSIMKDAPNYLTYVASLVNRYVSSEGITVDFGAGNGLQSLFMCKPHDRYFCVDSDPRMQDELRALGYQVSSSLKTFISNSVETVVSVNCLEHIERDDGVISEILNILKVDGKVVIYVPALPFLFSEMDQKVGHYRRYTKKSLAALFSESEFEINHLAYVDVLGIFATILYKYLPVNSSGTSSRGLKLYDRFLVPGTILLDQLIGYRAGKNLLIVATKRTKD